MLSSIWYSQIAYCIDLSWEDHHNHNSIRDTDIPLLHCSDVYRSKCWKTAFDKKKSFHFTVRVFYSKLTAFYKEF